MRIQWDELLTKEQILDCYELYADRLTKSINNIKSLKAKNQKFETIQETCLGKIQDLLDASLKQMNQVKNETVWDKLVIAFFGETNAGKSTVIETFRVKYKDPAREIAIRNNNGKPVDGLIVGDGRSDFTQIYEKYNLTIDDNPFVLIDVPGIEGKEANYLEEIGTALKQAHCIFYVQGHNTKPNAATAEKIKGFLSDWVNVYSIYNVRGAASDYDEDEERELLMTTDKKEREKSIQDVFEKILPGIYKGNVSCQGLLALLSVANFHESRVDLIEKQKKILSYFGSREEVLQFSRFSDIEELVRSQSADFYQNILSANRSKLKGLSKRINSGLSDIITDQKQKLDALNEQLSEFKSSIARFQTEATAIMRKEMHSEVFQALSALRAASSDIIDNYNNRDEWAKRLSKRINQIRDLLEESLGEIYRKGVHEYHNRIESKRKDLDKIKYLKLSIPEAEIDVNLELSEILSALNLSFKEAIAELFRAFFSPVGTLIKLFKRSDDGREKAKQIVAAEIEKAKSSMNSEVNHYLERIINGIQREEKALLIPINTEKNNISNLKKELAALQREFCDNK